MRVCCLRACGCGGFDGGGGCGVGGRSGGCGVSIDSVSDSASDSASDVSSLRGGGGGGGGSSSATISAGLGSMRFLGRRLGGGGGGNSKGSNGILRLGAILTRCYGGLVLSSFVMVMKNSYGII